MKSILFKPSGKITNTIALLALLMTVSACDDTKDANGKDAPPRSTDGVSPDISPSEYLPFYIAFRKDGTPDIRAFTQENWSAKVMDVGVEAFPINARIKRAESITLVTYEGSCEILIPTPAGYKKIIIQNDAICASIKP